MRIDQHSAVTQHVNSVWVVVKVVCNTSVEMHTLKPVKLNQNTVFFSIGIPFFIRHFLFFKAIYGDPFFTAGSKAYHKLMSNSLRVFTINSIGDFVLFLGKVFVIAITIVSGMELLRPKTDIHHIWVPLMLAGIFAYLISHCFITVYEVRSAFHQEFLLSYHTILHSNAYACSIFVF